MPATNPIDLIALSLANTIKMVVTPMDYVFQSGAIGDLFYLSWFFLN